MLKITFPILVFALALTATAAFSAEWNTDYAKALADAKASNKCVLLDFNGSDWCGPCIEMKKVVFSSPAFNAYAKKKLVLLDVDFPQKKELPEKLAKQNAHLEKLYKTDGYPTVVVLDPKGKVLGQRGGYNGEKAAGIIAWIEKLKKK